MGSCNSGDYIAEDHVHMDITTCNIKEPQQKYRLGMVSNIILGGGGLKHVLPFASAVVQNIWST